MGLLHSYNSRSSHITVQSDWNAFPWPKGLCPYLPTADINMDIRVLLITSAWQHLHNTTWQQHGNGNLCDIMVLNVWLKWNLVSWKVQFQALRMGKVHHQILFIREVTDNATNTCAFSYLWEKKHLGKGELHHNLHWGKVDSTWATHIAKRNEKLASVCFESSSKTHEHHKLWLFKA